MTRALPPFPVTTVGSVTRLVLEYATPRAGALVDQGAKELGLGVVNPRSNEVEPVEEIRARIDAALLTAPPGRIFLNPDCGSLARRPDARHRT